MSEGPISYPEGTSSSPVDRQLTEGAIGSENTAAPSSFDHSCDIHAEASKEEVSVKPKVSAVSYQIYQDQKWNRFEEEFRYIQRVGVLYAALLLIVLVFPVSAFRLGFNERIIGLWTECICYSTIIGFAWFWRGELSGCLERKKVDRKVWVIAAVAPILTIAAASLVILLIRSLGIPLNKSLWAEMGDQSSLWEMYLRLAILPAVFEEIAFRGLIFTKLQRVMTVTQAAWVSAIMFGILHLNMIGFALFLVPLALIAAWLTHRTGTLWFAMIIHFLHNAGIVTIYACSR